MVLLEKRLAPLVLFFFASSVLALEGPVEGPPIETKLRSSPQIVSDEGILQVESRFNWLTGKQFAVLAHDFDISYGVLPNLGVRIVFQSILHFRDQSLRLRSFGDTFLLLNWHLLRRTNYLMTLISGFKVPTGTRAITAVTSSRSLDFFADLQTFFKSEHWYAESDYFLLLKIKELGRVRFGNVYDFSYALGRRYLLSANKMQSQLLLLGRITGDHRRKVVIEGITSENSGGTLILLGPDLIWSYNSIVLRGLFQIPISERPFGRPATINFRGLFSAKLIF